MLKGLSAWIAGAALALSLVAPAIVSANREGEVRYYPSGQTIRYYPSAEAQVAGDEPMDVHEADVNYVPTGTVHVAPTVEAVTIASEPGMIIAGNRIYYISDNPRYDLSGSNESIYLVHDGTSYRAPSSQTATFAAAVGVHHQVVAVPAEYRQDWLAVAAGDRPVRCIPAVGAVAPSAAVMPTQVTYREVPGDSDTDARYTDTGTRYVKRARTRTVTHARKSRYSNTNGYFVRREIPAETVAYERVEAPSYTTASLTAEAAPMGDLYQIGNRWYMENDGEWSRSDSWRGPFFPVKKGHVPREVRESAEREQSFEE